MLIVSSADEANSLISSAKDRGGLDSCSFSLIRSLRTDSDKVYIMSSYCILHNLLKALWVMITMWPHPVCPPTAASAPGFSAWGPADRKHQLILDMDSDGHSNLHRFQMQHQSLWHFHIADGAVSIMDECLCFKERELKQNASTKHTKMSSSSKIHA